MPRTVVPPPNFRGIESEEDSYQDKLIKYIPGETLAFYIPVSEALGASHPVTQIVMLALGAAGTVGYLALAARKLDDAHRPRNFFYPLALVAFILWALGTTRPIAELIGLDSAVSGILLPVAVFLIPLADGLLGNRR